MLLEHGGQVLWKGADGSVAIGEEVGAGLGEKPQRPPTPLTVVDFTVRLFNLKTTKVFTADYFCLPHGKPRKVPVFLLVT